MKLRRKLPPSKTTFFAIDPGISGTGVAIFRNRNLVGNITFAGAKGDEWEERSSQIISSLETHLLDWRNTYGCYTAYVERPKFMQTGKGFVSASSDSLFKLIFHYGRIFQLLTHCKITVIQKAVTWKGTLSKKQTEYRLKKLLPNFKPIADHDCDAVAMGLHVMGRFG